MKKGENNKKRDGKTTTKTATWSRNKEKRRFFEFFALFFSLHLSVILFSSPVLEFIHTIATGKIIVEAPNNANQDDCTQIGCDDVKKNGKRFIEKVEV